MAKQILTPERLKEVFRYDADTGLFVRLAGRPIGWAHRGYLYLSIDGRNYSQHRLAWLYVYGKHPEGEIDHIDGCKANNSISNLRDVPRQLNAENARVAHRHNKSGLLGVQAKKIGGFEAWIQSKGVRHYLGWFKRADIAHEAYIEAKRRLHEGCTI